MRLRAALAAAVVAVLALVPGADAAPAGETVTIPFAQLGYRDGVTAAGVAPSVTFDLPRYAGLEAATLRLELAISRDADPQSTIAVAVNGTETFRRRLAEIGDDATLQIPLPLPPPGAPVFAITVSGALRVAGDPCANGSSHKLFLRIGRESSLLVRTAAGGGAEAFFRDYRGAIDVVAAPGDPRAAAVPYLLDRLEPWHRLDTTLVDRPRPGARTIVLADGPTRRDGDVLHIAPAALAALPVPLRGTPERHGGHVLFSELRQNLREERGVGDLAFDIPLEGSVVGGTPRGLRVRALVAHSSIPPAATGTLQILVNGVLVGARILGRPAGTQTIDVAVPQAVVGPSNELRVLVATDIPAAACSAGIAPITASVLPDSSFSWRAIERQPPSIESFLTALSGRVAVLVAPAFTRGAFHFLNEAGKMDGAITRLDVSRFDGTIPDGYDFVLAFAPPDALAHLRLPLRTDAPAYAVMNPTDGAHVLDVTPSTRFALLQVAKVRGTPLLAISYHGDAGALAQLENVAGTQLATQIAPVTIVDEGGATTYDIGQKLRVEYPGELTLAGVWDRVRAAVLVLVLIGIVLGARYSARRLTGRTI